MKVKELTPIEKRIVSVIRSTIASFCEVSEDFPTARSQRRAFVYPRYYMAYFVKEMIPDLNLAQIGSLFGDKKDHAFVIHALRTIENLRDTEDEVRSTLARLDDAITPRYLSVLMNNGSIGKALPKKYVAYEEVIRKNKNMQFFYENVYNQNQLIEAVAKKVWDDLHENPKMRAGDFKNYFKTLFDIEGVFEIASIADGHQNKKM